jgi:hypothetical protein
LEKLRKLKLEYNIGEKADLERTHYKFPPLKELIEKCLDLESIHLLRIRVNSNPEELASYLKVLS